MKNGRQDRHQPRKMEANQAKIGAEIKIIQEDMKEEVNAQVGFRASQIDANQENMKEEIKSGQTEMISTVCVTQEKAETVIRSIRSELEETIKHRLENVLSCRTKEVGPPQGTDRED
jgi:hypothetical protein